MPAAHNHHNTTEKSAPLASNLRERLQLIQHIALDMDGTIYRGGTLFDCTRPFLTQLTGLGIGYTFLTNNSSKSVPDYVAHLHALGIAAAPEQIYTSTTATIEFLRATMPAIRRLFVLGTTSMRTEISAAGFSLTAESAEDEPEAVLIGFDTELSFSRLCRAAYWIQQGKPFLASHPDRVCPTDQKTVWVDCGAICAALKEATGRSPDAVLGKPAPRMLRGLLQKLELRPEHLVMVGDRLYTDIVMAQHAGIMGVLVLSGEATVAEAARHQPPPDLVVKNLAELGRILQTTHEGKAS